MENSINKFSYYPLFNRIDQISKETIINEIEAKNNIIILGENPLISNEKNNNKIIHLHSNISNINKPEIPNNKMDNLPINENFFINFNIPILDIKFDSSILSKMNYSNVKDLGKIYNLNNFFLKIKTKRDKKPNLEEISLISQDDIKINSTNKVNIFLKEKEDNLEDLDYIYNKVSMKLMEIKKEISKFLNDEVIIYGDFISNRNKEFKLYLKNDEMVLEGGYNSTYMKIRKFIKGYIRAEI